MIKAILKKIIPVKIRKNAFLFFNVVKIKTVDKFFFREKRILPKEFLIWEEKNPFLECSVPTSHFPERIKEKLQLWTDPAWKQDKYFLYYKTTALIEPETGWAITSDHRLIYASLGFSRAPYVHKPDLVETYFRRKKVVNIDRVISLRDTGEENYFHFFNDILAKLFFIEEQNFSLAKFTVVVSDKLFRKEFFQFFWKNSRLKELTLYIQKDEWISFNEAIFCKPFTHTKKYLDLAIKLVFPSISNQQHRRIFLTRSRNSLRFIENIEELEPLLELHKFEIIDTAGLTIQTQIEIFSCCRCLVSIHGAGLTNMIFRQGNSMEILEIVPPSDYIPFHYIMLAHQYNYRYNVMLGEKGQLQNYGGFRIDPKVFMVHLENLIKLVDSNKVSF
jgi:hypothetical protein